METPNVDINVDIPVINTEDSGFFQGLNKSISLISILITVVFLAWVMLSPDTATLIPVSYTHLTLPTILLV